MKNKFEKIDDEAFISAHKNAITKSDIAKNLGLYINGKTMKYINSTLERLKLTAVSRVYKSKWTKVSLNCPVCGNLYTTMLNHPRSKKTCSYACSNTYFRSGKNNGSYINGKNVYRFKAFLNNEHHCRVCKYDTYPDVLEVHHKDGDRSNNNLSNLELLCPTCHEEEHYLSKTGKWKNSK